MSLLAFQLGNQPKEALPIPDAGFMSILIDNTDGYIWGRNSAGTLVQFIGPLSNSWSLDGNTTGAEKSIGSLDAFDVAFISGGDTKMVYYSGGNAEEDPIFGAVNSSGTVNFYYATATPEGVIAANVGDICFENDNNIGRLYIKQVPGDGTTGWLDLTSAAMTAFVDGGNAFAQDAEIGTTDAYDLIFVTSGSEVGRFYTTGQMVIGDLNLLTGAKLDVKGQIVSDNNGGATETNSDAPFAAIRNSTGAPNYFSGWQYTFEVGGGPWGIANNYVNNTFQFLSSATATMAYGGGSVAVPNNKITFFIEGYVGYSIFFLSILYLNPTK